MTQGITYLPHEVAAELCRRRFSVFVREMWSIVIAEQLVWEPHMDVLCSEIQAVYERVFLRVDPNDPEPDPAKKRKIRLPKLYDLIINIPPGTSKSTIVTIMAPAWAWTRDASLRMITGSYSDSLATEHAVKSRDIVQSDKYRLYFPEVAIKDDKGLKTNYETTANGQRFATSVGGTVTGVHGHVNTVDDPLNAKEGASAVACKRANEWMDKGLSTRKIDKEVTVTILMMQRLSVNDCTGYMLAKKKTNIRLVCLPGELSNDVSPAEYAAIYQNGLLSPKRLSRSALNELKIDLGSAGYAGQIGQRPAPEGGLVWQKWFIAVPDHLFPSPKDVTDLSNDWDLAFTSEEHNAASAFVQSGTIDHRIFIFDFDWRWLEFPELIKWMKEIDGHHYIEAKASGKSAKQTLTRQGVIAVEVPVVGGADKVARARAATPVAESGIVYVKQSMIDRLYNDEKQGLLHFPNGPYKDLADAFAQMLQRRGNRRKISVGDENAGLAIPAGQKNQIDPLEDWE